MKNLIKFDDVNDRIISIRNQNVILDSDVAELYGVQTKEVNQAVKNNPDKFPKGYIIELKNSEFHGLRSKILTANLEKTRVLPKAFTEKGLYMLATILKSPQATETTIAIVETFAKLRELSSNLIALSSMEEEAIRPEVLQSSGGLLKDLLFSAFPQSSAETSLEVNLGVMKLKREVKNEHPDILRNNQTIQERFDELERMILEIKNRLANDS